jgi:hypothetical protein
MIGSRTACCIGPATKLASCALTSPLVPWASYIQRNAGTPRSALPRDPIALGALICPEGLGGLEGEMVR